MAEHLQRQYERNEASTSSMPGSEPQIGRGPTFTSERGDIGDMGRTLEINLTSPNKSQEAKSEPKQLEPTPKQVSAAPEDKKKSSVGQEMDTLPTVSQEFPVDHDSLARTNDSINHTAIMEDFKQPWDELKDKLQKNLREIGDRFSLGYPMLSSLASSASLDQHSVSRIRDLHKLHQKVIDLFDDMSKAVGSFEENLCKECQQFPEASEAYKHLHEVWKQTTMLKSTIDGCHYSALLKNDTIDSEYEFMERHIKQGNSENVQYALSDIRSYMKNLLITGVKSSIQSIDDALYNRECPVSSQWTSKEDQIEKEHYSSGTHETEPEDIYNLSDDEDWVNNALS